LGSSFCTWSVLQVLAPTLAEQDAREGDERFVRRQVPRHGQRPDHRRARNGHRILCFGAAITETAKTAASSRRRWTGEWEALFC